MADNFGCRSLCCHLLSLLLIFKKSEEAVLLHLQYIILQFISVIYKAVFVVENAIIDKEMHSHKLSAMADNYPTDWCINLSVCTRLHLRHNNIFPVDRMPQKINRLMLYVW